MSHDCGDGPLLPNEIMVAGLALSYRITDLLVVTLLNP